MVSPKGGAMRIRREGGVISMWDSAAPFWLLGLFLLAGGITGMAMPLGLATNPADLEPWERLTRPAHRNGRIERRAVVADAAPGHDASARSYPPLSSPARAVCCKLMADLTALATSSTANNC